MAKVSSSNTTTLYSTTQTTPILPGAPVPTGPVNTTNFTTLYSQTNGVPGGGASDDLLVKGNLRVLGTSDLEGRVTIGNSYSLPTVDGTDGQVMTTDGNGNVTFEDSTGLGKTYDISATTTTGGANFNLNSDVPTTDTIKFAQGTGISVTATSANEITIASTTPGTTYDFNASSATGGANLNLVGSDSTTDTVKLTDGGHITATYTSATEVTLGSDATNANTANAIVSRDASGNFTAGQGAFDTSIKINGSTSGSSTFTAPATGSTLSYVLPGTAGAASTVLTNDGSGNLSWSAGGGGTYTIDASTTTGGANFNLQNGGTDTIKFAEGSNISITATSANEITIAATGSTNIFGNLEVGATPDLNTIKSINTNGDVELQPNGTGDVLLTADTVRVGDANATATITTNGTGNMVLNTNSGTNSGNITINQGADADIVLAPNGTGDVYLTADTTVVGDANALATITTNGTGDLVLSTNSGTNSGTIGIVNGVNGAIVLSPNGAGDVYLSADTTIIGDINAAATLTTNGTGNLTLSTNNGTNSGTIVINQGANANIEVTPNGLGDVYLNADIIRVGDLNSATTITTNGTGNLTLNTNNGSSSGSITIPSGVNSNITIATSGTGDVYVDADTLRVGDLNQNATITTNGSSGLTITNGAATSSITLFNNITLAPVGSGDVYLDADTVRIGDSGVAATITTNGAGNLTLSTNSGTNSGTIEIAQGIDADITLTTTSSTPGISGDINLVAETIKLGIPTGGTPVITSANNISIVAAGASPGQISVNSSGSVVLRAGTTSDYIFLQSQTTLFGEGTGPAYIGTYEAGGNPQQDLVLQTGDPNFPGTNPTAKITIKPGTNADLLLVPNGTGRTSITNGTIANNLQFNGSTSGTVQFAAPATAGTQAYTLPTAVPAVSGYVLSSDTSGVLSWAVNGTTSTFGNVTIGVDTAQTISTTSGNLILQTAAGVNAGTITLNSGANGDIVIAPDGTGNLQVLGQQVIIGDTGGSYGEITSPSGAGIRVSPSGGGTGQGAYYIYPGANGDIAVNPDGTGAVRLEADSVKVGKFGTTGLVTSYGAGDLTLNTNSGTNSGSINIVAGVDGNITIQPDGLGSIYLTHGDPNAGSAVFVGNGTDTAAIVSNGATNLLALCDPFNPAGQAAFFLDATNGNVEFVVGPQIGAKVVLGGPLTQVGDGSSAATITTDGAYNLNINTNNGTNTGAGIILGQGTNGTLQLNASGSGSVVLNGTNNATGAVVARRSQTTTSTGQNVMAVQRNYTLATLSGMDGHFAGLAFSQRDSAGTQAFYSRVAGVYSTTGAHTITFDKSTDGFITTVRQAEVGDDFFALGDVTGTADQYLTTEGAKSLTLITEKGLGGLANIRVNPGTDADIEITPDGTGQAVITNMNYNEVVYTGGSTTGTITPDVGANGTIQSITLTGSITFNAFSNPVSGQTLTLIITQPAAGGPYTLTSTMKFAGASKTLSTAANAIDILTVSYIGTTYYASLAKGFA